MASSSISCYNCGGRNRIWQLFVSNSEKLYYLYYLQNGHLKCVKLKLFLIEFIKV